MTDIIVNADDFGLNESCSRAIAAAFARGLVSSTTAMANGEYIDEAYELAAGGGFIDKVGVHITLTEGAPLTENIKNDPFFCRDGVFHGEINRLKPLSAKRKAEIREEVSAQIEKLQKLGFPIDHADSHHHIHTGIFLFSPIKKVLLAHGIKKVRLHRNFGDISLLKRVVKGLYNGSLRRSGFITTEKMGSFEDLAKYPETAEKFVCEIMVHPDFNEKGEIVDRVDYENAVAVGEKLDGIARFLEKAKPISFAEL